MSDLLQNIMNTNEILLSKNDNREYRYITLLNHLKVLLIHDINTEKCAASCDVRVGSLSDPIHTQGLAHFLEHMLFMGTEKYPLENEYSIYLNAHGGSSNAYTDKEDTVYYFDIQNDYFQHALDIFSTFFYCPLFNESSTIRELNAVDNENTKNLQSDSWRTFQLFKSLAKSDHPLTKFSTGNIETLKTIPEEKGLNVREMLLDFHKQYYSANVMTLVIYGSQPLDTLQKWVEEKFTPIENKNLSYPKFPPEPFGPEQLGVIIEVVPVKDIKELEIYIPLPPVLEHFRSKPVEYLSHLIGHESNGSILSTLKALGFANSLGAMLHSSTSDYAFFSATIGLTDLGIQHISEIMTIFFEYIGMLRREGPKEWIAKEVKETNELAFRFISKIDPSDYVVRLAEAMHIYPKELIVAGEKLVFDISENSLEIVRSFLEYFTPQNCALMVKYQGFQGKTSLIERWYGTQYNIRPFKIDEINEWTEARNGKIRKELFLPQPNPFIATDFTVYEVSDEWKEIHEKSRKFGPVLMTKVIKEEIILNEYYDDVVCNVTGEKATETSEEKSEVQEQEQGQEVQTCTDKDDGEEREEDDGNLSPSNKILQSYGRNHMVWFLQDSVWKVPKLNVYMSIRTGYAYNSPLNVALCELFANILKEILNEFSYYADCAGLYHEMTHTNYGFELSFSGYHEKLPNLINKVVDEISRMIHLKARETEGSSSPIKDIFHRLKEKILRSYSNTLFWSPYNQCLVGTLMCLEDPRWSNSDKYLALSRASFETFESFCEVILKNIFCEIFIMGNITPQESNDLANQIITKLAFDPLLSSLEPTKRTILLDSTKEYHFRQHCSQTNPNELNSAIENTYLTGDYIGLLPENLIESYLSESLSPLSEDITDWSPLVKSAVLELIVHLISEPCFDQLRTKEQLGYLVHSSGTNVGYQCGLRVLIQSNSQDPIYLNERIETFLCDYYEIVQALSEEELNHNRQAVIENLLEKPKNINSETNRYWSEISSSTYLFTRKQLQAKIISSLRLGDLLLFYRNYLLPSSPLRTKFSSQFFGRGKKMPRKPVDSHTTKEIVVIRDPFSFKRTRPQQPVKSYYEMVQATIW